MNGINGAHPSVAGSSTSATQQPLADEATAPASTARERETSPLASPKKPRRATSQSADSPPRSRTALPAEVLTSVGRWLSGDLSKPESRSDLLSLSLASRSTAAAIRPQFIAAQIAHKASTTDTPAGFRALLATTFGPIDVGGRRLPHDLQADVLVEVFKVLEMLPHEDMATAIGLALQAGEHLPAEFRAGPASGLAESVGSSPPNGRQEAFELVGKFIRGMPPALRAGPLIRLFDQIGALTEVEEITEAISTAMDYISEIAPHHRLEPTLAALRQFGLMDNDVDIPAKLERTILLVDSMPPHDRPKCLHEMSVASSWIEDGAVARQARDRIIECMHRFAVDSATPRA